MSPTSPASVVQAQLDAYNAKDLEALLGTYATDAEHYSLHGDLLAKGHEQLRARFLVRFEEPNLQARLLSRIVVGNVVTDAELITRDFPEGTGTLEMLCIYEVVDGRIRKASFAVGQKTVGAFIPGATMFSHIFTSVSDFQRAFAFYGAVLGELQFELRFHDPDKPWAGWHAPGGARPIFVISMPFDGLPHQPGNGQMVAFSARDRSSVRAAYRTALRLGGRSEGEPGLRPQYHANYYGAYFRDTEGNKIGVVSHDPE